VMFFLALVVLPIAFVLIVGRVAIGRDWRAIIWSLLFAAAAAISAIWSIKQSRSSTAGIGYLGVPFLAAIGGLLGLAFGRWRTAPDVPRKVGASLAFIAAIAVVGMGVHEGRITRARNATRDDAQAILSATIARNRDAIDDALKRNPGREREYLDSAIRAHINDRAFLLAALPHDSISATLLDTLASSTDLGITLEAVRNPNTSAETLSRIYKTHTYPDYFFQALAAHHHTPPEILRSLHHNPGVMSNLDIWLAANPSTPKDVLEDIGKTATDQRVIGQLLENSALDCGVLTQVGVRLTKAPQRDPPDPNVMRATERLPDVCLARVKL
jgi:hypothetical protein